MSSNATPYFASGSYAARSQQAYTSYNNEGYNTGQQQSVTPQPPPPPTNFYHPQQIHNILDIEAEEQSKMLSESIANVQKASHYMRDAMERDDLPEALEKATIMLGELGDVKALNHGRGHSHAQNNINQTGGMMDPPASTKVLSPKNYYELHTLALQELPNLEEFFLSLNPDRHSLPHLYEVVQYCPRVVPRLYLQICVASAWVRSETASLDIKWILEDLKEAVRCVQCPIRGLFLRYYLLQVLRDKLPDATEEDQSNNNTMNDMMAPSLEEEGQLNESYQNGSETIDDGMMGRLSVNDITTDSATVKDSYQFILCNLIEMNKLWVRIQHMPGGQKSKEARKKRERERNELRVLVGTSIVRLSELEGVTSAVYGTVILPKVLDHIVACRDPLAQAYLMDCMIQVFPDEFHIQTLEVILGVCPKLREKVNIRTILQSLMDRLSKYYSDELLLNDEEDTEGVKTSVMLDAFQIFEDCIESVLEAKANRVTAREIVRLESSLLDFSLKCYPGRMDHLNRCLGVCASVLRGNWNGRAGLLANGEVGPKSIQLDDLAVCELEKLLSLPLESLSFRVLELKNYSELLAFLPWNNRKLVAVAMLNSVVSSGEMPMDLDQIEQLFSIITPLLREESYMYHMDKQVENDPQRLKSGTAPKDDILPEHQALIAKLLHNLHHEDTDSHYEILCVIRKQLPLSDVNRAVYTIPALIFAALKLLNRIRSSEFPSPQSRILNQEKEEEMNHAEEAENDKESRMDYNVEEREIANDKVVIEETISNEEKVIVDNEEAVGSKDNDDVEKVEDNSVESDTNVVDCATTGHEEQEDDIEDSVEEKLENTNTTEDTNNKSQESEGKETINVDMIQQVAPLFSKKTNCRHIFLFVQKTLAQLKVSSPKSFFNLTLRAAAAADCCATVAKQHENRKQDFNPVTYEFMTQAFLFYEGELSDSNSQRNAIVAIVGTLLSLKNVETSDYEALITKTTQYAARLLKKSDQCKMILLCSHLFYTGDEESAYRQPQRVLECLQRALKIADALTKSAPSNLYLLVDILDRYIYFFERKNPLITDKFLSTLIALINEHISSIGSQSVTIADTKSHLMGILQYIKEKKVESSSDNTFSEIVC